MTDAGRAPALWIVIPACLGIFAARMWPLSHPAALCLAGLGFILAVWALLRAEVGQRSPRRWALATLGAGIAIFWSYGSVRFLDRLEWKEALPPREAALELRIKNVYPMDPFGFQRGIARVTKAPEIQKYLVGQNVIYRMKGDLDAAPGMTVTAQGLIRREPLATESGSFDAWLNRNEVYFEFYRAQLLAETAPPGWYDRTARATRGWLRATLLAGSEKLPQIRAIVPAMLLGEKNLLAPEDKALFTGTGMMHLFAVSGLHVGLVALTLEGLLSGLRLPRMQRILIAQMVLLGYVGLIGAPPSAVRAFLMIFFHRAFALSGRPTRGLPALAASATAVIVWEPRQLFDIGAQLSYGIVAGIMLYGAPLAKAMQERMPLYEDLPTVDHHFRHKLMLKTRNWLCAATGSSFAAFLVGVPLTLQYFGTFAPGAVLLNLLMIPLATLAAAAAVLSTLLAALALAPGLGWAMSGSHFLNHAAWLSAWLMQGIPQSVAHLPGLFQRMSAPPAGLGGALTVLILALMLVPHGTKKGAGTLWMLAPVAALAAFVTTCALF